MQIFFDINSILFYFSGLLSLHENEFWLPSTRLPMRALQTENMCEMLHKGKISIMAMLLYLNPQNFWILDICQSIVNVTCLYFR
jgi:hypothetical protein